MITQSLTPDSVLRGDWRQDGARGRYDRHFTAFARNLVAAGLGGSVIRLAHESNYEGNKNFVGTSRSDQLAWRRFWARAVRTMRRVHGAHFSFDWTINAYWQPLPLASIYPGDGVVDIVGIDAYDAGIRETSDRWRVVATRPNGVNAVAALRPRPPQAAEHPRMGPDAARRAVARRRRQPGLHRRHRAHVADEPHRLPRVLLRGRYCRGTASLTSLARAASCHAALDVSHAARAAITG